MALARLGELSQVWNEISAAAGAAGRLGEILAIKPKIIAAHTRRAAPLAREGRDRLRSCQFRLSDPAGMRRRCTIFLSGSRRGETVAIVGPSGAGKSTIFQLLLRFYDPTSGVIDLDGTDIKTVDPADLRRNISLVPQEPVIFASSFADNIRYGAPQASEAAVEAAAKKAAAQNFIAATPKGYATNIGERGVTLSGGERQRLAIARAILREAPVLLLDEATSALDAASEGLVQHALEELKQGRTTLVIAHRLATVLSADRILVLEAGRIVEEGTHASLVARDGLYAKLAKMQFETGALALNGSRSAAAE